MHQDFGNHVKFLCIQAYVKIINSLGVLQLSLFLAFFLSCKNISYQVTA